MEYQEKELLTLELQLNKLIQDFKVRTGREVIAINEDYNYFDSDKAHDGLRGDIIQLYIVPTDEQALAEIKDFFGD